MAQSSSYGLLRLRSKDAQSAIVQKLASDFNLTPIIAEAFYSQFVLYFQEHANVSLSIAPSAALWNGHPSAALLRRRRRRAR